MRAGGKLVALAIASAGCSETGQVLGPPIEQGSEPPVLAASELALGAHHGCATFSGQVACWGANDEGQLGLGDERHRPAPALFLARVFRTIVGGEDHGCGIDDLGDLYCWGRNSRGQLGIGSREPSSSPVRIELPDRAVSLSAGFQHTCVILADRSLWCFGQNGEGELGQGGVYRADVEQNDFLAPVNVPGEWRAVDAGQGHTCGIRVDGTLWCWGRNDRRQLGVGDEIQIREPVRVSADTDWQSVQCGQQHGCALRTDRTLWCWGENNGSAGGDGAPLGTEANNARTPTRVSPTAWRAFATNTFHSCAIDDAFDLHCWGRNVEGQLGLGDTELRRAPTRVGVGYAEVSVGHLHTCAVRRDGTVACAGENNRGQLGHGDDARTNELVAVVPPT